jgi:hypothetical protein
MAFILPMIVVLGSTLFLTSAFVALSPTGRQARDPGVDEDDEALPPSRSRTLTERQSSHA